MPHKVEDQNRRALNLNRSEIDNILPEHYSAEYPKLVSLLKSYYQFLDSDEDRGFVTKISEILSVRDISQTREENLDQLLTEIGDGLTAASFFKQPRLMIRLLSGFYRAKGTLVSAEGFFRGFFNEEATIEYPKKQMFIVNESEVGYESQKFIQDDKLYQVFSILVKVGISTADYEALYKKFVHPAGWHFAGEVSTAGEVNLGISGLGLNPLESAGDPILASEVDLNVVSEFAQLTGLVDSAGKQIRISVGTLVDNYSSLTATQLNNQYGSIKELLSPNSFTFDDSSDVDTSITLETMDNTIFTRYTSDSSI